MMAALPFTEGMLVQKKKKIIAVIDILWLRKQLNKKKNLKNPTKF